MLDPPYRYWLKKGRLEGRLDVARNLLSEGFPIEKVVKFTGLSKEDILNGKQSKTNKKGVVTWKVKKSAKITKVKITLNKVNGKFLSKKTLKIKFNKKTYKVKTNKKGVATWKVKKSMLKKLKVGKKVKYTVTYGKAVVTKKLTIKK